MSDSQTNYKLDEAQEIMNELRTIKKSITLGEKERQDLIQVRHFSLHNVKVSKQPRYINYYYIKNT